MGLMNWRKLSDKPPLIHHCYHWKVGNIEGYSSYGVHGFEFGLEKFEPSDEEIFWLDEMAPDTEMTVNELKWVIRMTENWDDEDLVGIIEHRIKELENNCPQDPKQGDMCLYKMFTPDIDKKM